MMSWSESQTERDGDRERVVARAARALAWPAHCDDHANDQAEDERRRAHNDLYSSLSRV